MSKPRTVAALVAAVAIGGSADPPDLALPLATFHRAVPCS